MYLTKKELEFMEVLWTAEKPLIRDEILLRSVDAMWKPSSIHILLNQLLQKGVIVEAGFRKNGRSVGRCYAPSITREQYYVDLLCGSHVNLAQLLQELLRADSFSFEELSAAKQILDQRGRDVDLLMTTEGEYDGQLR